jgi:hypothetical protein
MTTWFARSFRGPVKRYLKLGKIMSNIGITVEELIQLYEQQGLPNKDTGIKKAIANAITLAATRVYVKVTAKTDDLEGRFTLLAELTNQLLQAVNHLAGASERPRENTRVTGGARVCYCGTRVHGGKCDTCGRE